MKAFARSMTQTVRALRTAAVTIAVLLVLGLHLPLALAQSGAGSIQGTVTDPTGAVLPGAKIHVVNNATGVASDTQSNGVGFYQVPSLFTGSYTVTVTAPEMKTYKTAVEVLVDQHAVVNPVLAAGSVTQQVEVAADVVQLTTTENGTIASTLENARINQLPMNGRTIYGLAGQTTPGLEASGSRANGLMGEALEYVADGVPMLNREFGGASAGGTTLDQLPDPDAVQEVRIETTNTSAQFATPGTAILTTKSGTNGLHGSFFETARNNGIGVAKARSNPYNYVAPHLVRNEFGASAGGPIRVPHLYNGENKSFWFFAYERYSLRSATSQSSPVATAAMKGGDFSGLVNGTTGILQQLYDPNTTAASANCNGTGTANTYCRAPFAGNKIPIARLSPLAKILYDMYPLPTTADNPLSTNNITYPALNNNTIPTITFRVDHSFDEKNKAYLRYTHNIGLGESLRNNPNEPVSLAADGLPAAANGLAVNPTDNFGAGIGFTHVFSPNFYSETIISQQWFGQHNYAGGAPMTDFEKQLGIPNNFGEPGMPAIATNSLTPIAGTLFQYGLAQTVWNADENLTKTYGRHQLQFGGRYRFEHFSYLSMSTETESFGAYATALVNPATIASQAFSGTSNTGYVDGDLFLGAASNYQVTHQPPVPHFHDFEVDGYFQDNLHVSNRLTVNIGLRWEAHPAPYVKDGLIPSYDFKNHAVVMVNPISYYISNGFTTQAIVSSMQNLGITVETPAQAGFPSQLFRNYNSTVSPRIGVAYQPFGGSHGTVLRGAFGRYIYAMPVRNYIINPIGDVPYAASYSESYTSGAQSPDNLNNYLMRAPQTVIAGQNSSGVINSAGTNSLLPGLGFFAINPTFPPDFVTQANVTLEQPLKGNSALRLSWVYSHGTNLDQYYSVNNHPSTYVWEMAKGVGTPGGTYSATATGPYDQTMFNGFTWQQKQGFSNDNALQATYQRLFHRGIAYQVNYVWSHPFRVGGNYFRDSTIYPWGDYAGDNANVGTMSSPYGSLGPVVAPPAQPSNIVSYATNHTMNRFQNYILDSAIPKQHITFNGVVDLPFGRGKKILGNANRLLDEVVGGFQIAGAGQVVSQVFQVANGNFGPVNPLKSYKHGAKITDCTSGVCHPAYEWFNGYIAPTVAAGFNGSCTLAANNIQGLPSDWKPYQQPIDTDCVTTDPAYKYYNSNEVVVNSSSLVNAPVGYSPGPVGVNPYSHTFLNGPINYNVDLSLFKVFPITEKSNLRFNIDAFNALNIQGYTNPNTTTGVEQVQPGVGVASSYWSARQIQLTMRLTF